jgi:tRNA 2-selenouridine synthase
MDAYVINMHNDFMRQDSIKGFDNFAQYWLRSLEKIQKRLGLERYNALYIGIHTDFKTLFNIGF